jgi:hypothetical protein
MSRKDRERIAWEIICRIDTVTLCTCEEVAEIHRKAQTGEFDELLAPLTAFERED